MPMYSNIPKYDPEVAKELEGEGLDPNDATRQAATTMDGANETETGEICSTQTNCDDLGYNETLSIPREVKEGKDISEGRIREEFRLTGNQNIDKFVDDWIKSQS